MENTRTEVQSNIILTDEDKIKNVKYIILQLHYHSVVSFYSKDNVNFCKFKILNSNIWKIEYDLPLMYCFDYREIYQKGSGDEHEYYHAIFKDLKLILLSNEDDEWFLSLFNTENNEEKEHILEIKNIYKNIRENILETIGLQKFEELMLLLSEI